MKKVVYIPKYLLSGIKKNHISTQLRVRVFGGDTETCKGEPFLLQICDDNKKTQLLKVNKDNILKSFLKYFDNNLKKDETGVIYFHNLSFDLVALLYGEDLTLFKKSSFKLYKHNWNMEFFTGKTYFAKLHRKRKVLWIIDSKAFLNFSLDRVSQVLNFKYKKLKRPDGIGEKIFTDDEFYKYAEQDAMVEQELGEWIINIHKQFDAKICVSLPQLSATIFRHKFLKVNDNIQLPPNDVLKASLLSYHGGKNGMYVKGGYYENVKEIDINSAYPYALTIIPSFLKGSYKEVDKFVPEHCGVYRISGIVDCPYNIFFTKDFKPIKGKFNDIWVTGYELSEALKYNEVKLTSINGYIWVEKSERNPFADYVNYFYNKKQETKSDNPMYMFYKLALNSLYGKLIQMVNEETDFTKKVDYIETYDKSGNIILKRVQKTFRAGGLFNPFIATMITGKVRSMIHTLEHKFNAIHTATDSIKTLDYVDGFSNQLGGYKLEVEGDCVLFRNKLYLHFDKDKVLKKYALHGFHGSVSDLIKLYDEKGRIYYVDHLYKVKEALVQKKKALKMDYNVEKTLSIDWNNFLYKKVDWSKYKFKK